MKTAVLLLAYGGPDSLADIPAYLLDIRGGRATPQALIDEISHRYAEIGGFSPLLRITQSAAAQLQARTGLPTEVLQARLLELELDGRLSRLPGGLFQRLIQA